MGKPIAKKSKSISSKFTKSLDRNSKAFDEDTAIFITMSQELKEEGNKLFQKRDHEGAMLKYEKALNLLPKSHIDVASLRSNMATCYMQMGLGQYPRAISECNLALEVAPKFSKALLKRARCYEALDRLDLALRDVNQVLSIEPNNLNALEISESVKTAIGKKGVEFDDKEVVLVPECVEPTNKKISWKSAKDKVKKKKNNKQVSLKKNEEKKDEETVVVQIKKSIKEERTVKLVLGEDIRCAQLAVNCDIKALRDVVKDRYSSLKGVLIKYKDQDGDLVTITTTDELRLAEKSGDKKGSLRFYVVDVSPEKDPLYETHESDHVVASAINSDQGKVLEDGVLQKKRDTEKRKCSVDDWIIQFARLFKNHVGFDSDSYLDLHEIGMKLYSEAMEDTVTDEDSQKLFEIAAEKFQEMAALALFNWGNVHMSRARKRVLFTEGGDNEYILEQIKNAYEWAKREYVKAGSHYTEALRIKPDFYEGLLALGLQQFDQAKLVWYHAIGSEIDLGLGTDTEILQLYNNAEDSIERGMQMWEEREEQRLNGLLKDDKYKADLENFGLGGLIKDVTAEEAKEQASNMSSQIYLLWGTMLYERSIVEFKLGLPTWEECLEVAVEKFELAGATQTDIAVMIKNHCSNDSAVDGLGFKIDEIVQAWNEMYDVKRWQTGVPSFRLEPLLRRRVPELHSMLENF